MELKKIDIEEFEKNIYPEYEKIFPALERKPCERIKNTYERGIVDIFEINVDNNLVGFIMANHLETNPYIQLDYFAIFEKYRGKGHGTEALKLLREVYKDYDGIFIEIEKVGLGENEEENVIREKREMFYRNLGFIKLDFDLELFTVIYSAHMLLCKKKILNDENIKKNIFDFYISIIGEERARQNCKIIA